MVYNFTFRRFCGLTFSQCRLVEGFSVIYKNVTAFIFIKLNAAVNIPSTCYVFRYYLKVAESTKTCCDE